MIPVNMGESTELPCQKKKKKKKKNGEVYLPKDGEKRQEYRCGCGRGRRLYNEAHRAAH
jgi:hypothetical protein